MMRADVALLPSQLNTQGLAHRLVVISDVLRATTTMIAAGRLALEDVIAAGAVLAALRHRVELESDAARLALAAWESARDDLPAALRQSTGGRNVIRAGLAEDIDYAARLDSHDLVAEVARRDPIFIRLLR